MNKQLFVSLALETALNVFETKETGTHRLDLRTKNDEDDDIPEQLTLKEATLSAFGRVPGMEDTWYGEVIWAEGNTEATVVEELRKKDDEDIWSEE